MEIEMGREMGMKKEWKCQKIYQLDRKNNNQG